MCVTLIGGMDRLKRDYMAVAEEEGVTLSCVARNERNFEQKVGNPDAILVFTNKISHEAKRKAVQIARAKAIPIALIHSCGISSLKKGLSDFR